MKFSRSLLVSMAVFVAVSAGAYAQSNPTLDIIIATNHATFGEAAYLVLTATNKIPDNSSFAQASSVIEKQGWKIEPAPSGQEITLGTYSYMIMRALGMHGGIMYAIFPGPRYAERELDYLGFIHGYATPYRRLSGIEAVSILGEVMRAKGGSR